MTDVITTLSRPRGDYGYDGDYRVIPAPVVAGTFALTCLGLAASAVRAGTRGSAAALPLGGAAALVTGAGALALHTTRVGKFQVWARVLAGLGLRGDERVLDMGCGRGAVLFAVAKLLPRGRATGIDIWRADQTGNGPEAAWHNAELEGVKDRVDLDTGDMTRLPYDDASFDLVVSSLAVHNLPGMAARLAAVDEAARVLKPGGRLALVDIGFTRRYAARLRELGMRGVDRRDLGWRVWWTGPWFSTHLVTATKPANRS